MKKRLNQVLLTAYIHSTTSAQEFVSAAKRKLKGKDGGLWSEYGLLIVIGVVLAAIILALAVALIKDKIFPKVNDKVDDFFAIS